MSLQQGQGRPPFPSSRAEIPDFSRDIAGPQTFLGGFFGIVGSLHRVCATVKDRADQGSLPVRRRMVAAAFLVYLLTRQAA